MSEITYYNDLIQGTEEWKAVRRGILTASQTKSLVTATGKIADNNDSRAIVFEKVSERIDSNADDYEFSNNHMERGNTFEPFARDLYSEKVVPVQECGFVVRDFGGFKIGYSPDGLVGDDGLIEIKCPAKVKHIKEICLDIEPKDYMMQMQTGLLVTGRKWIDYVSFYNGLHMRVVRVFPDLALHEKIKEATKVLEDNIKSNIEVYNQKTQSMHKSIFIEGISI